MRKHGFNRRLREKGLSQSANSPNHGGHRVHLTHKRTIGADGSIIAPEEALCERTEVWPKESDCLLRFSLRDILSPTTTSRALGTVGIDETATLNFMKIRREMLNNEWSCLFKRNPSPESTDAMTERFDTNLQMNREAIRFGRP